MTGLKAMRLEMTIAAVLAAIWLGGAAAARAEHRVGNGGDAVVCRNPDGTLKSAELLDFYEVRELGDGDLSLGAADMPAEDKAVWALQRIARFDPVRGARWTAVAKRFFAEARLMENAQLEDIPDSWHIAYREGCRVEQLAIQRKPLFPGDKRYVINAGLWRALPRDDQAGLILHEIFYGEALRLGQPDSIMTRHLTGFVASGKLDAAGAAEYRAAIARVGFDAEHWLDGQRGWRFALLPHAPQQTLLEAQAACAALAGDYVVPNIRKLLDVHPRLAVSRLSELLFDEATGQAPEALVWSASAAGGTCGQDGARKIKAFALPADILPPRVEIVCETDTAPRTLCLSEYWVDVVMGAQRNQTLQQHQDDPAANGDGSGTASDSENP